MQSLSMDAFAARANETFALQLGESSIEMTLVQTIRMTPHLYPGMQRDPFKLVFKSQSPVVLPQKIYSFRNATMGKLGIFIVPVARDKDGIVYEAIFN